MTDKEKIEQAKVALAARDYAKNMRPASDNGESWERRVSFEAGVEWRDKNPGPQVSDLKSIINWLLLGNTGASSRYLLATHLGLPQDYYYPRDKGDRRRCIQLLKEYPAGISTLLSLEKTDSNWATQGPLIRQELETA